MKVFTLKMTPFGSFNLQASVLHFGASIQSSPASGVTFIKLSYLRNTEKLNGNTEGFEFYKKIQIRIDGDNNESSIDHFYVKNWIIFPFYRITYKGFFYKIGTWPYLKTRADAMLTRIKKTILAME